MISLTFFIRLTIHIFYKYFCKSINKQFKSKVPLVIDIMIYILSVLRLAPTLTSEIRHDQSLDGRC
jgi:hypothetical protein